MRKIVITMGIIFLLIIGLVSCSNDNHIDLSSGKYAVIYTDSTQRKSELVILDENGQIVSSENMNSN